MIYSLAVGTKIKPKGLQNYLIMSDHANKGRNNNSPLKPLENSRRFLSSSDIRESAASYLYNQQMLDAARGIAQVSPKAQSQMSQKPSDVLKRNLYKLDRL